MSASRRAARDAPPRWWLFLAWALAGACLALFVSVIGAFTVLPGLVMAGALAFLAPREALGIVAGAGTVAVVIGGLNLDYTPCRSGVVVLTPPQTDYECGGFDGTPWLVAGIAAIAAAVLAFWILRRRLESRFPRQEAQ